MTFSLNNKILSKLILFCLMLILYIVAEAGQRRSKSSDTCSPEQRRQIEQMLIVNAPFSTEDFIYAKNVIFPKHQNIGGFLFFGGDSLSNNGIKTRDDFRRFLAELKEMTQVPPFFAIDYEATPKVRRLEGIEMSPVPEPLEMGAEVQYNEYKNSVSEVGKAVSRDLADLGLNWNLAPVADTTQGAPKSVMYEEGRIFHRDSNIVKKAVGYYVQGLQSDRRVMAGVKHFPNIGATEIDTHSNIVVVHKDWETLVNEDLQPFIEAINQGSGSLMLGAVKCPRIDPNEPIIAFSSKMIDHIRKDLKFNGVIVTDILRMGGEDVNWSWTEGARKAILAGVDMPMVKLGEVSSIVKDLCHRLTKVNGETQRLKEAISSANERIRTAKKNVGLINDFRE